MRSKLPRSQTASFLLAAFLGLGCVPMYSQVVYTPSQLTNLPTAEQVIQRSTDRYLGSIPQGKATDQIIDLTVEDALDRGLKYNLGLFLSDRTTEEAKAARLRALSQLLPNVNGAVSEEIQRINLKSFGFTFGGFPSSVGPFSIFAVGATGDWNAVNLSLIDNYKASGENLKAAKFSYKDARDTVVVAVGANYLLTIADESRVAAAEAQVRTAQALYQLAVDQENAGLAPNIDTLRSRVQLQSQQNELIVAENQLEKQRIALARVIGMPVQQKFRIASQFPYTPFPEMDLNNLYDRALQIRPDYQAALATLHAAKFNYDAAWKQRLPSIGASGGYEVLGFNPNSLAPNYNGILSLQIPVFQGGRIKSDIEATAAVLKQRQADVDNLRAQIEQDIQDSILDLKAAAQAVDVAKIGLDLAQQTLSQSQDRFSAGVTNNVEVIQAQQQLVTANDQWIASLYAHSIAKVLLARAVGNAEQAIRQYLSQPGNVLPNPAGSPPQPGTQPPAMQPPPPATTSPGGGMAPGDLFSGSTATGLNAATSNLQRNTAAQPMTGPTKSDAPEAASPSFSTDGQVRR